MELRPKKLKKHLTLIINNMAQIQLDGNFKVTGQVYVVHINSFVVFHSLFLTACYKYVCSTSTNSNDKLLKSYSQVTRSMNKYKQVILTDSINTEFMIKQNDLFK